MDGISGCGTIRDVGITVVDELDVAVEDSSCMPFAGIATETGAREVGDDGDDTNVATSPDTDGEGLFAVVATVPGRS